MPQMRIQYYELSQYCKKCGLELVKDANRCSENKSSSCAKTSFCDDDVYCDKCGALTTYAAERKQALEKA